jgi:hypothetical protein
MWTNFLVLESHYSGFARKDFPLPGMDWDKTNSSCVKTQLMPVNQGHD